MIEFGIDGFFRLNLVTFLQLAHSFELLRGQISSCMEVKIVQTPAALQNIKTELQSIQSRTQHVSLCVLK